MEKESSLASLFDHLGTDGETNLEGRLVLSAGPPRKKMCSGSGSRNRKANAAFVSFRYVQCPECGQSREAWQTTKDGYAITPRHYVTEAR